MPSKKIFPKPIFLFLLSVLLTLFIYLPGLAHDETNESEMEIAPLGKLNVRGAKTSNIKILIKYPTTLANKKMLMEIFLNDLVSNEPISGVNVTQIFNLVSEKTNSSFPPIFVNALPTEEKGSYLGEVIFSKPGEYKLTLIMSKPGIDAQIIIPKIIIPQQLPILLQNNIPPKTKTFNFLIILILPSILGITLAIITVRKYLKRNYGNTNHSK